MNRETFRKVREDLRKEKAIKIKTWFLNFDPDNLVLHWNSKILPDGIDGKNEHRLPILVTHDK